MKKFIRTHDKDISNKLCKMGYQKIYESNDEYVFLNSDSIKINFTNETDIKKIMFSNIITFQ